MWMTLWHNVAISNVYLQLYKQVTSNKVFPRAGARSYQAIMRTGAQLPSTLVNVTWGWWIACVPSAWEVVAGAQNKLAREISWRSEFKRETLNQYIKRTVIKESAWHWPLVTTRSHMGLHHPAPHHETWLHAWNLETKKKISDCFKNVYNCVCASFIAFLDCSRPTGIGMVVPVQMTEVS